MYKFAKIAASAALAGYLASCSPSVGKNPVQNIQILQRYLEKADYSPGLIVLKNGDSHGGPFFNKSVTIIKDNLTINLARVDDKDFLVGYETKNPKESHLWLDRGSDGIADVYDFNETTSDTYIQSGYEKGLEFVIRNLR